MATIVTDIALMSVTDRQLTPLLNTMEDEYDDVLHAKGTINNFYNSETAKLLLKRPGIGNHIREMSIDLSRLLERYHMVS